METACEIAIAEVILAEWLVRVRVRLGLFPTSISEKLIFEPLVIRQE